LKRPRQSLKVEVLTVAGCSSARQTVELIERVAAEIKAPVDITQTVIGSPVEARGRLFAGSPTVLVEGADIDPSPRGPDIAYGLA
jgi:hypothetical protein